jgi:DNA gyrase subunit B
MLGAACIEAGKLMSEEKPKYTEDMILRLNPREHIRLRPGMYIGGVNQRALHQMVFEVLNDPVEEAFLGNCDQISLTLHANDVVTIRDNSQGLPVRLTQEGSFLELIMTRNVRRRIRSEYPIRGGTMGVGLSAVNALSSDCTVEVARDDFLWRQTYREGVAQTEVVQVRPLESGESTGTSLTFRPDFTILERNSFDYDTIRARVRELAYLLPGLTITLTDDRGQIPLHEEFCSGNGLADYVSDLNEQRRALHIPLTGSAEWTIRQKSNEYTVRVDVALQYAESMETRIVGYVNTVLTSGGLHIDAIPFALSSLLRDWKYPELEERISREECLPGLTAVVSVRHPHPHFESQTKIELLNHDVVSIVFDAVRDALHHSEHQAAHARIVEKCLANRRARP